MAQFPVLLSLVCARHVFLPFFGGFCLPLCFGMRDLIRSSRGVPSVPEAAASPLFLHPMNGDGGIHSTATYRFACGFEAGGAAAASPDHGRSGHRGRRGSAAAGFDVAAISVAADGVIFCICLLLIFRG
ncbi:uncharacterized protein [Triticum aestivum]|uniref:uncharacterized protein n=1 Tax=Triticum aestivum TaxID=4565 RepID=UPI001D01F833|nr:uncharacterized protein LOC123107159 [Triticum aestivum]